MSFRIVGVVLGLGWTLGVWGQSTVSYDQAITWALAEHLDVKISRLDAEIARSQTGLGFANMLPRVDASASYSRSREDSLTEFASGSPIDQANAESTTVAGSVDVSYTLFDGFSGFFRLKRLGRLADLSDVQFRQAVEATLVRVSDLYYRLAYFQKAVRVADKDVRVSELELERFKQYVQWGSQAQDALDEMIARHGTRVDLQRQVIESLDHTQEELNQVLGQPHQNGLEVDEEVSFQGLPPEDDLYDAVVQSNTTLEMVRYDQLITELDYRLALSSLSPKIVASGGYGYSKNESDAGFSTLSRRQGLSALVGIEMNLFNGTKLGTLKQANLLKKQNQLSNEQLKLDIERSFRFIFDQYQNEHALLSQQEQDIAALDRQIDQKRRLHEWGQLDQISLARTQVDLAFKKLEVSETRYAIKSLEMALLRLAGQLLGSGIQTPVTQ